VAISFQTEIWLLKFALRVVNVFRNKKLPSHFSRLRQENRFELGPLKQTTMLSAEIKISGTIIYVIPTLGKRFFLSKTKNIQN
jgi:hypothetical protein